MPRRAFPDPASEPERASTRRVQLARAAHSAIVRMKGVSATAGPDSRWRTLDGDRSIEGVVAVESADGRVELGLHLRAAWPPPPLSEVGERLRELVARSAHDAALGDVLGEVRVFFHDVLTVHEAANPQ